MTDGQHRAELELERLIAASDGSFELVDKPTIKNGWLVATISLRIGPIESKEGGLDLREREEFVLFVPPQFPFDRPGLNVTHTRFAGFPHVSWVHWLCLYQSSVQWNPSDGLYGFFDRLKTWLGRAAINEMDPADGPLEPPHHITDHTQRPFVIRANAPCAPGEHWVGLAILDKQQNRTELVGWNPLSGEWPTQGQLAFAVFLPEPLPMEFPAMGAELFQAIQKAGMDRERIFRNLALAALLSPEGEPMHLVLGLPMRRARDGTQRTHIAVWTVSAAIAGYLRSALPDNTDSEQIRLTRENIGNLLESHLETSQITWCKVLEDRPEIVVRRDEGTPIAWFAGKKILILGCGALGSWASEIIVRARPSDIHLVDNAMVKPGVLARQNFELRDIGANKAITLARRLGAINHGCTIAPHECDAHAFCIEDKGRFRDYDMVLDCTASSIFQMKLERDWLTFSRSTPLLISLAIDSQARHCLCVVVPKNSGAGVWDAYLSLKRSLCIDGNHRELVKSFYSETASEKLFQPEPGCSDPTFIGSTADVIGITSNALNVAIKNQQVGNFGMAFSAPEVGSRAGVFGFLEPPRFVDTVVGKYRIRIATNIFSQAKSWVRQNGRRRSPDHETGGLLWGVWDDATQVIWIFDLSGPPSDSQHNPAHFVCGVRGTAEEHRRRKERAMGACGFVGHWHTHPDLPSHQSNTDIGAMAALVSSIGQNQKRSAMLIFGRTRSKATAGIYIYESVSISGNGETLSVEMSQFNLEIPVV